MNLAYKLFTISLLAVLYAPDVSWAGSSIALGYTAKYPAHFHHFDYVNPAAPKGGDLILHGMGNFDSFNPFTLKGVKADGVSELVFESLMVQSLDEPYSLYGHIADDVSLAPDKKSISFHIDARARFSNGDRITAADVKFSFDTIKEKGHPIYRFIWADIKKAVLVDQYRIRFDLAADYQELPLIVAQIPVFAKKWAENKDFASISRELPIGSGPYIVDKYRLGKEIVYKRNPDYWARDKGTARGMYNFDRVIYKYYKDETVRLEALKAGEFHFLHENYSKLWAREHAGPKYAEGKIQKVELSHKNNAGMQGFIFNTRRKVFQDKRVRRAIALAYDFEWANRNLFYNQYVRCDSYFSNSELAARESPTGMELQLLKKYQRRYPGLITESMFNQVWQPSGIQDQQSLRQHLREAKHLLDTAGWTIQDGVLKNIKGEQLEFEVLLAGKGFERILDAFSHNLKKLGITVRYRTVDVSLYVRRARKFDFDMMVSNIGQNQLPGKELFGYWHSSVAEQEGSQNYAGIKSPLVDDLINEIVNAPDRGHRVTAARALDRVLLDGEYLVPNWFISHHRVAYWDRFGIPKLSPLYYQPTGWVLSSWWTKPELIRAERPE